MKGKLPQIRFSQPPQWQRERFRRWLQEWDLRHAMEEADSIAPGSSSEESLASAEAEAPYRENPFDPEIRPGDIRLIPHARAGSLDRPLFCAVLAAWPEEPGQTGDRLWVTCVFSSMGEAGLASEWQTGENVPFSVLSLWNSQLVPEGFLRESWCLETWPDATRQKALAIYKAWFLGQRIPSDLAEEVGPPIRHADDPRNQYLLKEQARGDSLGEAVRQWKIRNQTEISDSGLQSEWENTTALMFTSILIFVSHKCALQQRAAADDEPDVSDLAVVSSEDFEKYSSASKEPSLVEESRPSTKGEAVVVEGPKPEGEYGFIQWRIHPAQPDTKRVYVVDRVREQILGQARISSDGEVVTLEEVPWQTLEPFQRYRSQLADLTVVVVTA